MKYITAAFFICLILISNKTSAQNGCLLSDGRLFTNYSGGIITARLYHGTPMYLPAGYCSWSAPSTSSCNVCLGSINIGSLVCFGTTQYGQRGNYTMLECPIDDYAWLLIASSASIAFLKIRKKKD